MTAKEQIQAILARSRKAESQKRYRYYENLMDEVAQAGIRLVDFRAKLAKKKENIWNSILMQRLPRSFLHDCCRKKTAVSIFEK